MKPIHCQIVKPRPVAKRVGWVDQHSIQLLGGGGECQYWRDTSFSDDPYDKTDSLYQYIKVCFICLF